MEWRLSGGVSGSGGKLLFGKPAKDGFDDLQGRIGRHCFGDRAEGRLESGDPLRRYAVEREVGVGFYGAWLTRAEGEVTDTEKRVSDLKLVEGLFDLGNPFAHTRKQFSGVFCE